jgi:hypothetical protein
MSSYFGMRKGKAEALPYSQGAVVLAQNWTTESCQTEAKGDGCEAEADGLADGDRSSVRQSRGATYVVVSCDLSCCIGVDCLVD